MPTRLRAANGTYAMKLVTPLVHVCFALWLAACSGGDLAVSLPGEDPGPTLSLEFPPGSVVERPLPRISGGVPPYEASIEGCPDWVTLLPDQGILVGTAPVSEHGRTFFCTYVVTDSAILYGPQTKSFGLRLIVDSLTALGLVSSPTIPPLSIGVYHFEALPRARGGIEPYTYSLTCAGGALPDGMNFASETRVFAGIPNAQFHDSCTYTVTDNSEPAATASLPVEVLVDPLDLGTTWRFRTRTVEPEGPCVPPRPGTRTEVAILPHAQGGEAGQDVYVPSDFPDNHFLEFEPDTRQLTYVHPPAVPIRGTPNTYRYLVGTEGVNAANADDALCLDVWFSSRVVASDGRCVPSDRGAPPEVLFIHIQLQVRDDAYWDENAGEYRCPDTTAPELRSSGTQRLSNPVHAALAPVHGRRAADVAHTAIEDRVRNWSPAVQRTFTVSPSVDFASLSGQSDGFDYTGSSQSLSAGADLGSGSWQAGLVAAFTRTELRYRAAARLSEFGYQAGEHDTELFSVHPFAAWHAPSRGHLWASFGAGLGDLRHRDDLGFPSWSSSDVELRTYAAGVSVPLADVLSGELDAEAGIDSFAFDIEGGGQISNSLPTLRGRDYRAGLAWRAPVRGAPSVSLAYRQLTGDGPEGGQVVLGGSVSASGILDPRLTLTGSAEASLGLGDDQQDQDAWRLAGGIRFAPDDLGRGLDLDTRLFSLAEGHAAGVGVRGEAGYGLWSGSVLGVVRPYVGLIRYPGDGAVRRMVGLSLGDTWTSQFNVEVFDQSRDRSPALKLGIRHRF